jgi:methionyl aminopeptidase
MITIKTPQEIAMMREGGRMLAQAMDVVEAAVHPGVTAAELDRLAEKTIRAMGAEPAFKGYEGYPATMCVSVNHEVVHALPTNEKVLQEGDIVGCDLGVRWKGFCTDMARTIPVGRVTPEAQKLIQVTRDSLEHAISIVEPGKHVGDISAAVESFVKPYGYGIVRELVGHGIGVHLHEDPRIPNFGEAGTGALLREGMVIAIEPMINIGSYRVNVLPDGWTFVTVDGSQSAHFEDTIAITTDGHDVLTRSS